MLLLFYLLCMCNTVVSNKFIGVGMLIGGRKINLSQDDSSETSQDILQYFAGGTFSIGYDILFKIIKVTPNMKVFLRYNYHTTKSKSSESGSEDGVDRHFERFYPLNFLFSPLQFIVFIKYSFGIIFSVGWNYTGGINIYGKLNNLPILGIGISIRRYTYSINVIIYFEYDSDNNNTSKELRLNIELV